MALTLKFKISREDVADFMFFSGLLILLIYFILYFNEYTNFEESGIFGQKSTEKGLSESGFMLAFITILFVIFKNMIETGKVMLFSGYSFIVFFSLVQIFILYIISIELSREPESLNSFSPTANKTFFDNWSNSVIASQIFNLLFLYLVVRGKITNGTIFIISPIFLLATLLPSIILLRTPSEIDTVQENYETYHFDSILNWKQLRDMSYYASFSGLAVFLAFIYAVYVNYDFKDFIK